MHFRIHIKEGDSSLRLGMTISLTMLVLILQGQPAGYYDQAAGLTGTTLQQALHDIIDNHISVDYSTLPDYFETTDKRPDGNVWDMYSDIPSGTPSYLYQYNEDECGNYGKEGDCFNREHSFPKSWFGGEIYPMYSDMFHLYPTDGYVNGKRGNYPFGTTVSPSWTSTNGSKLGPCSYTGYSGIVFEPINAYKGDFARSYFYMAVRYYSEDASWTGSDMVTGSQLKTWALRMLMEWDTSDPVSQKERDRNNAVYAIQGNRNPFIDNTSYVSLIWGSQNSLEDMFSKYVLRVWPNPASITATIEVPEQIASSYNIRIVNISGKVIMDKSAAGSPVIVDVISLETGYYIVLISANGRVHSSPLVITH
jgi:endonuclease I